MPQLDFFIIFIQFFWCLSGFFVVRFIVESYIKMLQRRKALILALKVKAINSKSSLPKIRTIFL